MKVIWFLALLLLGCDVGTVAPEVEYPQLEFWSTCFVHFTSEKQDSCFFYVVGDVQNIGNTDIKSVVPFLNVFRSEDYDSSKVFVRGEGVLGVPAYVIRSYGMSSTKSGLRAGERLAFYVATDTVAYLPLINGTWYLLGFRLGEK